MATKKAQSKAPAASSSNDMSAMWKWLYVAGVVVAGLMGMKLSFLSFLEGSITSWILLLVGLLVGFFYFDSADVQNFGLRYLILWAASTAATQWIAPVGQYVGGFLTGFFMFLGPVVVAQILAYFAKKYFM
jgi:hypothetical protein